MTIDFNFTSAIVFALISQGIFTCLILLLKKENRRANRYLSILSFLLSLWLIDTFFRASGLYGQNPDLYFLPIYFSLGFGPLIYFYTKELTKINPVPTSVKLIHFIPVLIQFFLYIFLQTRDYSFRREFWFNVHLPFTYDLELILSFSSLIIYLILSRHLITHYKLRLENSFSNTHRVALRWLNQLHLGLALLSFLWIIESIGRLIWSYYPVTPFSSISIGVFILLIGIGAILQKDLQPISLAINQDLDRYTPDAHGADIDPKDVERIQRIMLKEQLFLQQELTLAEFAQHVNLSPRETSRLINHAIGISFIDFVNQYRVNQFKRLSSSGNYDHLNLLAIAYESGFNSKSTFNRVFKKLEGKSPSAYLNET